MYVQDFDGTIIELTDAQVEAMLRRDYKLDEVCRYHREKGGVMCNQKRRKDSDCERCGWNPRVARMRTKKIKERLGELGEWV